MSYSSKTRRKFLTDTLRLSSGTMAAATCLPSMLSSPLLNAETQGEFKALVYIFLAGGNDSFNMISPTGNGALRTRYEQGRRNVAIDQDSLIDIRLSTPANIFGGGSYNNFGMHPKCKDIASIFNSGEIAVICNMGNLVEPTSRQDYLQNKVVLPPQLFSHSDQQRQFQSQPSAQFQSGWGGRTSEFLTGFNPDLNVSPLISVSGLNPFQVNQNPNINTFVMSHEGLITLNRFDSDRKRMVEAYMAAHTKHLMSQKYQSTFSSAQKANSVLENAFEIASASGVNYEEIFSAAGASETDIGKQLMTVAKMITGRGSYQNQRPIFFVRMDGFDTHKNVIDGQASLLTELNGALKAFRDVLEQQNDFDKVLSFIGSEFGRTFTPNSDGENAGTDHAWGGHALVMGGMIEGARFYGTHPDLRLGDGLESDKNKARGRWIPTTSTSQCSAVIAHWLGVPRTNLNQVFPSLSNFLDPFDEQANLGFIAKGA